MRVARGMIELAALEKHRRPLVLVVEDDPGQRRLIERAFRNERALELRVESTLEAAQQAVSEALPQLVVADWRLPDGLGIELADGPVDTARYPLVVMTAHGDEYVAVEAMRGGAIDYVIKTTQALREMPRISRRAIREWGRVRDEATESDPVNDPPDPLAAFSLDTAEAVGHIAARLRQGLETGSAEELDEVLRCADHLTARLLACAGRLSAEDREHLRPAGIAREAVARLVRLTGTDVIELKIDPVLPWVDANAERLVEALCELGLNALEAAATHVTLRCRELVRAGRTCIAFEMADNGSGPSEAAVARGTEPLFGTKGAIGLGLTHVAAVAASCDGTFEFSANAAGGALARLILPSARS